MPGVDGVLRVLLAIDAGESAQALREQLEREGCSVSMVATGAQVLATAVDPYDLIFIDLELPDAEGLTILHLMRSDARLATTPVVLIRGEGEPDDLIQQGLDLGASGYLVKQRLRSHLIRGGLIEMFLGTAPYDPERRQVPRSPMARPDACPYSARGDFHACAAFVPHEIKLGLNNGAARTSCSHLRVGTAATWRLYPRCALGDAAARQKYQLDLIC